MHYKDIPFHFFSRLHCQPVRMLAIGCLLVHPKDGSLTMIVLSACVCFTLLIHITVVLPITSSSKYCKVRTSDFWKDSETL